MNAELIMLAIALLVLVVFIYMYLALKMKLPYLVEERFREWQLSEKERLVAEIEEMISAQSAAAFQEWKLKEEKNIRRDALERSRSVVTGKATEHLLPYLPGFNYSPRDTRFLGSPFDLLVFDGLSEKRLREIVFIEVKTGSSALSPEERQVRDAVKERRVSWHEIRR